MMMVTAVAPSGTLCTGNPFALYNNPNNPITASIYRRGSKAQEAGYHVSDEIIPLVCRKPGIHTQWPSYTVPPLSLVTSVMRRGIGKGTERTATRLKDWRRLHRRVLLS